MSALDRWLRILVFAVIVRPLVLLVIGLNVRNRERLPGSGPAIIAANHTSHLDTLVLMSLFPLSMLDKLRPVAAADYFLRTPAMAWFSRVIMGIIPIERQPPRPSRNTDVEALFAEPAAALARGEIVILFPEGTRGSGAMPGPFKAGIARLAERAPEAPVVPVFLAGLSKALPKGSWLPVPFFCDVFVGEPIRWPGNRAALMGRLKESISLLAAAGHVIDWDTYDSRNS